MKLTTILQRLPFFISKKRASPKNENPEMTLARSALLKNRRRTDLINYLIAIKEYKTYLEIGVAGGDNLFEIRIPHKVGVDPGIHSPAHFHLTSDEFFAKNKETFDIIFIDGLHHYEQVLKDINNSLNCLTPGGVIVMHDCLPQTEEQQNRKVIPGAWNGDVWKAAAYVRMHFSNVHFCVVDMDWGCGIITPNSSQKIFPALPIENMDWKFYLKNRKKLLNVISLEKWL